ncbi:metallophosphoesterase [Hallella colorans]|uniref:metallophosphoesterase n=1 Tax=Hallella colorans TaxID=1703337 RepID=UPI0023F1AEB9|nr:metallophosphoesterase [Hallella colorans]
MKIKIRHNSLMRLVFGSLLFIVLPGLLFLFLCPLVGWKIALVLPIMVWVVTIYGFFFGWRHIVVRQTVCSSPLLPVSFDGYRVLQISDIHIGTFLRNRQFVNKMVNLVNAQRADLIVFTGDLVNVSAEELIPFQHVLGQIRARDGVYSIMGNHDYCEYGENKNGRDVERNQTVLKYMERKMGWRLLLNEHAFVSNDSGDQIAVIGVENISRPPFQDYGDLQAAMRGLPRGMFKILLTHDPSHWRRGVLGQTDIALTLSGHTHAAQVRLGRFSPAKWAYNEWGGKYTEKGVMLHVSLGIGGTVPFRFGAWPEINIITLRHAK